MEQVPATVADALDLLERDRRRPRARWPGVLAGGAVLVAWRLASVQAFVEERDAALWLEVGLGAIGDLAWVVALYAALDLALAGGATSRGVSGANTAQRSLALSRFVGWMALAACLVLRAADFVHAWLTLAWFDAATWALASDGAGRVVFESGGPWVIALALGSAHALWIGWGGGRTRPAQPRAVARPRRPLGVGSLAVSGAAALAIGGASLGDPQHGARHPELGIAASVVGALTVGSADSTGQGAVDPAMWARWRQRGWVAPQASPDSVYPLRRVPAPPLQPAQTTTPLSAAGRVPGKPDVIVVYVESLNAGWLRGWRSADDPPPWSLPALDALAEGDAAPGGRGWTLVRGYRGAARPTLEGITASLCGVLPGPVALDVATPGALPQRDCLPALLAERGWRAAYLQGSPLGFTGLDAQLPAVGFEDVRGAQALRDSGASRGDGPWGARDAETFAAAAETVERLRTGSDPFLFVVAGVDSHWPGDAAAACAAESPCGGDAICAGLWCADRAVGGFLRRLEALGALDDSLVVVTADHTMPDPPDVRGRLPLRWRGRFGELALHVRVPWLALPPTLDVPSTNLDLAPTLTRWLGVRPPQVAWLGWPLDADRTHRRGAVARKGQRALAWLGDRAPPQVASPAAWSRRCAAGERGTAAADATLACDLVEWQAWYDAAWAARRIAPAAGP